MNSKTETGWWISILRGSSSKSDEAKNPFDMQDSKLKDDDENFDLFISEFSKTKEGLPAREDELTSFSLDKLIQIP